MASTTTAREADEPKDADAHPPALLAREFVTLTGFITSLLDTTREAQAARLLPSGSG